MDQGNKTVFFKGIEIKQELIRLIDGAEESIQAAVAWFTDPELFEGLKLALGRGVKVSLVVADNEENERLPFDSLTSLGAEVIKIKGRGRGIMHQKYVIIDEVLVASGSYNWSINAANNNSENLQIIEDIKEVGQYVSNFRDLMKGPNNLNGEAKIKDRGLNGKSALRKNEDPIKNGRSWADEYDEALQEIVFAHFNREKDRNFRDYGFERSEFYNGDPLSISTELDSIHGHLTESIDDRHKDVLLGQLDALKERYEETIDHAKDIDEKSLEKEFQIQEKAIANRRRLASDEIDSLNIELTQKESEKKGLDQERSDNDEAKMNLESRFAPHKINWIKLSFKLLLATGLVSYLFLFYSSAFYILLHAENDAQTILDSGGIPTPPGIFDSETWVKGYQKGGTTRLFLAMGVLMPLFLATSALYIKPKWLGHLVSVLLGIFGFDFFVAWKVSKTDHDIRFLSGLTGEEWQWADLWADSNFYLVFMFGAMGLFFFKFLASNVYAAFHSNDPEFQYLSMKAEMDGFKKKEMALQERLQKHQLEMAKLTQKKANLLVSRNEKDEEVILAETQKEREKNRLQKKAVEDKARIQRITERYRVRIAGGSITHMWSMVEGYYSEFVNGWVQFVYDFYAPERANRKQQDIISNYEIWKKGNYHG